ncbi:MAG: hypothetical protein HYZ42_02375 [Bacteroidetes bacterium]|nr:hypothetical protein [Bacteroidota bacterium]
MKLLLAEDNSTFDARPYYDKEALSIRIPYDRNDNKIADIWEIKEEIFSLNVSPNWDEDQIPVLRNKGDDIYVIDEYRGFYVEVDKVKKYTRFKANTKELVTFSKGDHRKETGEGTILFGNITGIKTYTMNAYTNMDLVASHPSMNSLFPKWLNYNSPTQHLTSLVVIWPTFRAELINKTDLSKKFQPHVLTSFTHDADASTNNLPSTPDGNGAYYPSEVDYIIMRLDYTLDNLLIEHINWAHPACDSVGECVPSIMRHSVHANKLYNAGIDTNTLSITISNSLPSLLAQFVIYETVHELGHATHVHHHNVDDPDPSNSFAYYKNSIYCPMRYWCTTGICENTYDWMVMFWANKWNPGSMVAPNGIEMKFCTDQDNCFNQMSLKKP